MKLPLITAVLVAAAVTLGAHAQDAGKAARFAQVKVAGHSLRVEVVDNDATRSRGLMHREKLGSDHGMLFVFDQPAYHSMWMKDTLIPLSVAFIDAKGTILNILDMEPRTLDTHMSAGPSVYAIEVNKGWFAQKKVKAGDTVAGLPRK